MISNIKDQYWVEKYRPEIIDDTIMPEDLKNKFREYIQKQDIPHLLMVGPPGTGKSTTAKILTRAIAKHKDDIMFINGSAKSERGIENIERVIEFMSIPPYKSERKIVFIDEADNLTPDAFKALRVPIENPRFNVNLKTRCIFTGNILNKIPDFIQSRLTCIIFDKPTENEIFDRCSKILELEKITFDENILKEIISIEYPDVRSIINNIQNSSVNGILTKQTIYTSTGVLIEQLTRLVNANSLDIAAEIRNEIRETLTDNISCEQILSKIMDVFIDDSITHMLAYRYHLTAFRSVNDKHTIMALVTDIIMTKFGWTESN